MKTVSCKGFCCAGSIANMVLLDIASREPVHGRLVDDAFEELEWKAHQANLFRLFTTSDLAPDTKKKKTASAKFHTCSILVVVLSILLKTPGYSQTKITGETSMEQIEAVSLPWVAYAFFFRPRCLG